MPITRVLANLTVSDLRRSEAWFTALLGRAPDARPMDGLIEWHHRSGAGLQFASEEGNGPKAG